MDTNRIDAKAALAIAAMQAMQAKAAQLATAEGINSEDWAKYANDLASSEGEAHAWARVQTTANYFAREGLELTPAAILETVAELLSVGADDGWSGRINDVRRARFDGIRKATTSIRYLVTD
jgi:hypothetical protein